VSGRKFEVKVIGAPFGPNGAAPAGAARKAPRRERKSGAGGGGAPGALISPIQGTVLKVAVQQGATVEEGALVCVIEAMKMENEITAPSAGTVEELGISEGGSVATGDTIAVIK
jgi:acetyl-CoA/propionyl-CoA carboxylase biotin carboxyl carrier protein